MLSRTRFKLHFGPYRTPSFNYGAKVQCEVRGELHIVGLTSAKIPWPVGKIGRPKPRPRHVNEALRKANLGRPLSTC